jgi:hypothetical protein
MSPFYRWAVKWARTVHLYLSLVGLGLLLFFAATGFTLNHEDWFLPPVEERTATAPCAVPAAWAAEPEKNELAIVEHLRKEYGRYVVGSLSTVEDAAGESAGGRKPLLEVDSESIRGVFKRPGSQVSVVIYRAEYEQKGKTAESDHTFQPGEGEITYTKNGGVIFLNDLHRAKDSSGAWHLLLDVVCLLVVLVAATGVVMWLSLKGRGRFGWAVALGGVALSVAVVVVFELVLVRN